MKDDLIKSFFDKSIENEFNQHILKDSYDIIKMDVERYIDRLIEIDIGYYNNYVENNCIDHALHSEDIFQFSKFEDATEDICNVLIEKQNIGVRYRDVGLLLQNDGLERTDLANQKYGENHFKMAEQLGLAFKQKGYCYLSSLGYAFPGIGDDKKRRLLTRMILRSKLISRLYRESNKGEVKLEIILYDLAETTYKRRKSNVKKVIDELCKSTEYDYTYFANKIIY